MSSSDYFLPEAIDIWIEKGEKQANECLNPKGRATPLTNEELGIAFLKTNFLFFRAIRTSKTETESIDVTRVLQIPIVRFAVASRILSRAVKNRGMTLQQLEALYNKDIQAMKSSDPKTLCSGLGCEDWLKSHFWQASLSPERSKRINEVVIGQLQRACNQAEQYYFASVIEKLEAYVVKRPIADSRTHQPAVTLAA